MTNLKSVRSLITTLALFLPCCMYSTTALAGEIFCIKTAGDHWDKINTKNRAAISKSQCLVAKYAGEIEIGDQDKVRQFLKENVVAYLDLDSAGGSFSEALEIGHIVRRHRLLTFVRTDDDRCDSACFFIWAGGIFRSGNPSIHRPYLPDQMLRDYSMEEADQIYREISTEIDRYFRELQIRQHLPADFTSVMMSTPPNRAFYLRDFANEAPGLFDSYEAGVEQYLLDSCGSLENNTCEANAFIENSIRSK